MKVAIFSDSHDNIWNLERALRQIKGQVEALFHLGDVVAPFTVEILAKANLPTYLVLGNNDADQIGMFQKSNNKFVWVPTGQQFGEVELDGRKIAYTHYPKLGKLLARSGEYDAVFYGHTHLTENKKIGKTLLLNPGAICGIIEGKPKTASYAIYDTSTNSAEIIKIK